MQGSDAKYFTVEGKHREYPELFRTAIQSGLVKPTSGKESEIDSWLMRIGWYRYQQRWDQHPGSFLPLFLHKFVRLWYGTESGSFVKQIGLGLCSIFVLPLALVSLWMMRSIHKIVFVTMSTIIVYFIILHLVGLPEFRYVFPLFPLLLLLASNMIIDLRKHVSDEH